MNRAMIPLLSLLMLLIVNAPLQAQPAQEGEAGAGQPAAGQRGGRGAGRGRRGATGGQRGARRGGRGGRRGGRGGRQGGRGGDQPAAVVIPEGTTEVHLWPDGAPGSEDRKDEPEQIRGETILNVHNPSILVFLPPEDAPETGVGLVLAPGGGHTSLWVMHEGVMPAQVLAEKGIAVFVLKNRLESSGYKFDVEGLADIQRAIRLVRSRAEEWGVNPNSVGAGGFSAGGELAGLVADNNDPGDPDAEDPVERFSSRPDFQALIYPGKSRRVIQPTADSPPAFMAAGYGDREDIGVGLAEAYLRFKAVGVEAELHMYANTGHGFGIRPERVAQSNQQWTTQLVAFLRQTQLIRPDAAAGGAQ